VISTRGEENDGEDELKEKKRDKLIGKGTTEPNGRRRASQEFYAVLQYTVVMIRFTSRKVPQRDCDAPVVYGAIR